MKEYGAANYWFWTTISALCLFVFIKAPPTNSRIWVYAGAGTLGMNIALLCRFYLKTRRPPSCLERP